LQQQGLKKKMATSERRHVCAGSPTAQGNCFPSSFTDINEYTGYFVPTLPKNFPNFLPLLSRQ
jgi:hypothetical protein